MNQKWIWAAVLLLAPPLCTSASAQERTVGEGDAIWEPIGDEPVQAERDAPASDTAESSDPPALCRPPCGADDTCVNGRCVREGSAGDGEGEAERAQPTGSNYSVASESGVSVGIRVGYAIPVGEAASGVAMSDSYSSQLPFVLDLGYRFNPNFYFGLIVDGALLTVADQACPESASCSGFGSRVGLNAQYRFIPRGPIDPWVGAGLGVELLSQTISLGGVDEELTFFGLELIQLQGGADFMATLQLRVGLYGRISVAQYLNSRLNHEDAKSIESKALHSWLEVGLRFAYDL
jgi:opacity protein-like surface antigen